MSLRVQTLWNMLPLFAVTAANLVSVPLFYRYLGPEQYGLWFYILTVSGAFGFMDLGLGVAVGRYVGLALGRNDTEAVREYWGTGNMIAIPLLLGMAILFCAVGALFGPKWFKLQPGNESLLQWCFVAAAPGLFLSYYGQFWNILAQAHLDFRFLAATRTIAALISIAVAVALARLTGSPLVLVWWSSLVAGLQLLVYVLHSLRSYGLHWSLRHARRTRVSEMMSYTVKTFITLLLGAFATSVDRILLGKLVPSAQFAHYSIGSNVGVRIQGLGASILGPVFHQSNRAVADSGLRNVRRIHGEAFSLIFGWCLLAISVSALWKLPLLRIWLGKDLSELVAPIFLPVVLASCLQVISSISGAQLSSLDRQGSVAFFQVARLILAMVGGILGWHIGGLAGFAWGTLLSRIADLGQDVLLTSIVGPVAWMTAEAARSFCIQLCIAGVFLVVSNFSSDWQTRACFAILHLVCGAIPLLHSWVTPRLKAMAWNSAD